MVTPRARVAADGSVVLRLSAVEYRVLAQLPEQLGELLQGPVDDPALERLFPRAYSDPAEEIAEHEWQALSQPALLRDKLDAISVVQASLPADPGADVVLAPEVADAWLRVVNDLRLVLAARADRSDVYRILSLLEEDLVEVLLA